MILAADSGCWGDWEIIHLCVMGSCPLQCNGSAVNSKQTVLKWLKVSVGGVVTKPLEYRWKGFEKAAAWVLRFRKQHDLLLACLKRICPPGVVKKSLAALERRRLQGADVVGDAAARKLTQNIRGVI